MLPILKKCIFIPAIFYVLITLPAYTQDTETTDGPETGKTEDLVEFMEEGMNEIDFYSLEELLDVEVEVASLFTEDELVVGSMVSSITSEQWKRLGARRTYEALNNELSVITLWHILGYRMVAIRGYATNSSMMGTAFLLDGVPLNEFSMGGITQAPNIDLGILDRIELIKGPGSAIYGSDAFHGVISMKSFESDNDHYSVEAAGAYPLYGDANVKISQGFAENLFRINAAAAVSGQAPQEREYEYEPNDAPGTSEYATRDENYSSQTGMLKLDVNPADRLKIKLGSYISHGEYNGFPGVAIMPNRLTFTIESLEDRDTSDVEALFGMGNMSAVYTFSNDISAELNGFYWQYKHEAVIMADYHGSVNCQDSKGSRSGANFIIKQPDNPLNLQWLAAYSLNYHKMKDTNMKYKSMVPVGEVIDYYGYNELLDMGPATYDGKERTIHSAYAQTKWGAIKNSLYLILGGRIDNYSDYGNQITPRAGLIYLPTENDSVKALYGRAFRAAVATEMYGIGGYTNENTDLEPETIDIYEIIVMHKEKKWKAIINGFYSKWKNGIISEFNNNLAAVMSGEEAPYNSVNKGENESYGGEFSIFYTIDPFAIDLGLSYVKSRAIDVKRLDMTSFSEKTIDEEEYVAFPEYIANAGLYYTLNPYNVNFYLHNRFYYGMKETHYNTNADPEDLPLYWRINLNIRKAVAEKAEFILDIRNMLNRKNYIPSPYGEKGGYEEPGISVLLRAEYTF